MNDEKSADLVQGAALPSTPGQSIIVNDSNSPVTVSIGGRSVVIPPGEWRRELVEENIERVARALCRAQGQNPDEREILHIPSVVGRGSGTTPPTVMKAMIAEPRWKRYTGDARVAIDAMFKD